MNSQLLDDGTQIVPFQPISTLLPHSSLDTRISIKFAKPSKPIKFTIQFVVCFVFKLKLIFEMKLDMIVLHK